MFGTTINAIAIIVGGLIGLLLNQRVKKDMHISINKALGIAVIVFGFNGIVSSMFHVAENGFLVSSGELILIISLILGTVVGEYFKIDYHLNQISKTLENKFKLSGFAQSFVSGTLIYCVGAMAIIGALNDGLRHDSSVLLIKSLLDGISSVVLAATMGVGVIFSAIPVFIYQGTIALLAGVLEPFISTTLLSQICAVGYCMVICIGLNFTLDAKIKTANLLPALLVPILWNLILSII